MTLEELVVGLAGAVIFTGILYYNKIILRHFQDHEEISMAMFFVNDRAHYVFQIVVGATVIYAAGMLYASLGVAYNKPFLGLFAKAGSILLFLCILYFMHTIADITAKQHNGEE